MRDDVVAEGLLRAAAATLRPLVKRLLQSGVPFGRLEARVRELFVDVAERELSIPGRAQTDSRVALLTGINRKEVRRLRGRGGAEAAPASFSRNHATALIGRWLADRHATDRAGKPRPLPYQAARGPCFVKLARAVTVDLPPRAILDELLRTGAVELRPDERVALRSDAYVPARGEPEKLAMLAQDPAELLETMLRNIFAEMPEALLQRKVFYDNLGADAADRVRRVLRREGERFLRRVDRLLARHDRDRNPRAAGGARRGAGMGIYYFEAPCVGDAPRVAAPRASQGRRRRAGSRRGATKEHR